MKQFVLALLVVIIHATATCQILYVNKDATGANDGSSWTDACTTLTAAVNAANVNTAVNEIRLAKNGAYTGTGYVIRRSFNISGSWNITTNTQEQNVSNTTLDGAFVHRIMTIETGVTTQLSGILFTRGGNIVGNGGAIVNQGNTAIAHCIFRDNKMVTATNANGYIYNIDMGGGGAVFNLGTLIIQYSQFIQNKGTAYGGAVLNRGAMDVINCHFENNETGVEGGAIMSSFPSSGTSPSSIRLFKCRFTGNYTTPQLNTMSLFEGGGGAVSLNMGNAVVANCIFDKNKSYSGGALQNERVASVRNCTFYANEAYNDQWVGQGGAIYSSPFDNAPAITIQNCALWDNTSRDTDDQSITIAGGTASIFNCLLPAGTVNGNTRTTYGDNINFYPFWVDPVNGDFRLQSGSGAIDKGNNNFSLATDEPGDFYGLLRISPCTIDIGAVEYQVVPANGVKPDNNGILYVDVTSTYFGFGDRGSDWSKALPSVTAALLYANTCGSVREIHVAKGNYQEATLTPQRGYIVKGSYDPATNTRDWKAHPTNIDLHPGNTSGRLMITESTVDSRPITLDGLVFQDATQTALVNEPNTVLVIANCTFYRNTSDNNGGAVSNLGTIRLFNCVFARNHSNTSAGALANFGTCTVVNTTFNDNSGPSQMSQVIDNNNMTSTLKIQNSIITNLRVAYSIFNQGNLELNRNIIQGYINGAPTYVNGQSIDRMEDAPLFIDAVNNDLGLNAGSPAINKGSNALYEAADGNNGNNSVGTDKDFDQQTRVFDGTIDLGAMERQMKQQTISVTDIAATYGDAPLEPGTINTGLPINYASANNNTAEGFTDTDNKIKIRIKNKGTAVVTASQAGNATYDPAPAVSFTLTVNPKSVTVTAETKSKVYGDADPALTYSVAPALVAGDAFTGNPGRESGEDAGVYAIQQNDLSLGDNYLITYAGADLTIDKKAIAITAESKSKIYGEADPAFTYSFSPALAFSDAFTGTLNRPAGEDAGDYAIQNGLSLNNNYTLSYTGANLTITKKAIAIAAESKSKVYGEADPVLTYTFSPALAFADAFTGTLNRPAGENTGSYAIQNGLSLSNNYTLSYTGANLVINPKVITVTAADKSKTYGAPDPALTYTAAPSLVGNDVLAGNINRATGEDAGTYAITQGNLSNPNYSISFVPGLLTIGKASQQITWNQLLTSACDGNSTITLTGTSSSGLPVLYQSANTAIATVTNNQLTILQPGLSNITASQPGNNNYLPAVNVINNLVSRLPASLLVKHWNDVLLFDNSSKAFNGWQWYKNGSPVNGATGQYYYESGNLTGEYYATVKTTGGETLSTCPITVTPGATLAPLTVFPNPVGPGQSVTVKVNYTAAQLQGATILITNSTGTVMNTQQNLSPQTSFSMPLIQGLYVVRLKLSNGISHAVNVLVKP